MRQTNFKAGTALSGNLWLLLPTTRLLLMGALQFVRTFQHLLTVSLRTEAQQRYLADHDALTSLQKPNGAGCRAERTAAADDGVLAVLE